MTTDRLYLVAGSIAPRLNESLPSTATVLETDLDTDRDMVHVRCVISRNGAVSMGASGSELYFGIEERAIRSHLEIDGEQVAQAKQFNLTAFISDTSWAEFVSNYITSEVTHFIAMNAPRPTINDLVKSQAESEQGFSLA